MLLRLTSEQLLSLSEMDMRSKRERLVARCCRTTSGWPFVDLWWLPSMARHRQVQALKIPRLRILRSKLNGLNEKSSSMKYDEFFMALELTIGEVERVALRERNVPAHGTKYSADKYPALLSRVRALETLFNRCVLKMSGGVETYVDYPTHGHPDRLLTDPLGGPRGDGKSG